MFKPIFQEMKHQQINIKTIFNKNVPKIANKIDRDLQIKLKKTNKIKVIPKSGDHQNFPNHIR